MNQKLSIQLQIPVANHIYKYLQIKCGIKPFVATRNTFVGSVVLSILNKNDDIRQESKQQHQCVFKVEVKEENFIRNGVFIDQRTAHVFNDLIDKMFREELYCHIIINKVNQKTQYLKCIRSFMAIYNITEEDIKEETIYRDFKRKKDQIEERMNIAS